LSNTIQITETNVNTLMSTYQGIQLERAAQSAGPFGLVTRIPYVTSQTLYTYVDSGGASTDWYRSARYTPSLVLGPYSAAWPVSGFGGGVTLQAYRQRLAEAAGFHIQVIATATASAANQAVVGDFVSSELENTFLGNTWCYQPTGANAGQIRRVVYGGLQSGTGTVTLEAPFSTPTTAGTLLEFDGRLPAIDREGRMGLNTIVNRVLAEAWTVQRIGTPVVDQQTIYPIAGVMPWLHWSDQIVDVYWQPPLTGVAQTTNGASQYDQLVPTWTFRSGADAPGIEIGSGLQVGGTLKPEVFVPMSWWVNRGSGWSVTTQEGLGTETDQALLTLQGMETLGLPWIYNELSKWGLPDDQANYRTLRAQARAAANQWKRLTLERPVGRKRHWPEMMVVPSRGNYAYSGYPWGP
jgi:hypothetical protein